MSNKIKLLQKLGLKSEINFCPICESLLRFFRANDNIFLVCQCGYSEGRYIVDKEANRIEKFFKCLICAKNFAKSESLHQHCKDTGHIVSKIFEKYKKQGYSIEKMIRVENTRKLRGDLKRNITLTYLVKRKHDFKCQLCELLSISQQSDQVETHHIIPLSENGKDNSENFIVLCRHHHEQAHKGMISFKKSQNLKLTYKSLTYTLKFN